MSCGRGTYRPVVTPSIPFCYVLMGTEKNLKESIVKNGFPYPKGFSVDGGSIEISSISNRKAHVTACGVMVAGICDSGDENHMIGIPAGSLTIHYCLGLEKDDGTSWKVLSYEITNPSCNEKCSGTCCLCSRHIDLEALIDDLRFQRLYCSAADCPADEDVARISRENGAVELRLYDRCDECHRGKYCTYIAEKDSDGFWRIMDKKCPPEK